jgi:hypothetical protein
VEYAYAPLSSKGVISRVAKNLSSVSIGKLENRTLTDDERRRYHKAELPIA